MFQLHATLLLEQGWQREGGAAGVACVKLHLSDFLACSTQTQNYICRWEMPHNQVTTTECRVDRHGRLKEAGRRGRRGRTVYEVTRSVRQTKLTIDRCNRSILAQWYVELPPPVSSPSLFVRKLHFVKAFLRLLLTKQRNAWEMARNKPWKAVNMQIVSRLRRSSTWFTSASTSIKSRFKFKCVDWLCLFCFARHFKLLMDFMSSSKFTKIMP